MRPDRTVTEIVGYPLHDRQYQCMVGRSSSAPESIDDFDWDDSHGVVDVKRQQVKESPTYDMHAPFNNQQGEST